VGYVETPNDQVWTSRPLAIPAGTVLLAASDGIVDQIGGPRRIAFGRQRLWQALDGSAPGECLRVRLERGYQAMARYQGAEERRDDVSLLAVQL
jgi:serine phosphatase RsbU (regulator of sigma subunit)